jgi:hypothetical protein
MTKDEKLPGCIHTSEVDEVKRLYREWDDGGGGAKWSELAVRLISGDASHDPLLPRSSAARTRLPTDGSCPNVGVPL